MEPLIPLAGLDPTRDQELFATISPYASRRPTRGLVSAAISSGIDQMQAAGGGAMAAVGRAIGFDPLRTMGEGIAQRNQLEAQENGRTDLDTAPWREGGASVAPWLAYQTIKNLPQMALQTGAFLATRGRGGMLGGGAAAAGVGYPLGVGSMYNSAGDRAEAGGAAVDRNDALAALALGVPYAAADAVLPSMVGGNLAKGVAGGIASRMGKAALMGAATEMPTEALQTGMEMSFRSDLTTKQKADQIIDAALTGAAVGGVFGGAGGVRGMRNTDPRQIDNDGLAASVDQDLSGPQPQGPPEGQLALPPPQKLLEGPRVPGMETDVDGQLRPDIIEPNRPMSAYPRDEVPSPFATMDAVALQRAASLLEQQRDTGRFTQNDAQLLAGVQQEIVSRNANGRQGDLFQDAPAQAAPTAPPVVKEIADKLGRLDQGITPEVEATQAAALARTGGKSNRLISQLRAVDEVAVVDEIDKQLTSRKSWSKDLMQLGQAYGLLTEDGKVRDLPKEEAALVKKIDVYQNRAKTAGPGAATQLLAKANEATTELEQIQELRSFQAQAQQRRVAAARQAQTQAERAQQQARTAEQNAAWDKLNAGRKAQAQADREKQARDAAWVAFEKVNNAQPTKQALEVARAAKLTDFETAYAERQAQIDNARMQAFPEAAVQAATDTSVRLSPEDVSPGRNPRIETERRKTVAAFNALPAEQQNAILDREDFQGNDQTPEGNLLAFINSDRNQPRLRRYLAEYAGVDPAVFEVAEPARPSDFNMADRSPAQVLRDDVTRLVEGMNRVPSSIREQATVALEKVRNLDPTAEQELATVMARYNAYRSGETVFNAATPADPTVAATTPPLGPVAFDVAFNRVARQLSAQSREAIQIVQSFADLPTAVQDTAEDRNFSPTNVKGVLHQGDVYIVRDNIKSEADLQETLLHEVFGHMGARALFGPTRTEAMLGLYNQVGGISGMRTIARKLGVLDQLNEYIPQGTLNDQQKVETFDEMLALAAGQNTGTFKQAMMEWAGRLKQGMAAFLRKAGFNAMADRLSNIGALDVAVMLRDMREAALQGQEGTDNGTAFRIDTRTVQGSVEGLKKIVSQAGERLTAIQSSKEGVWGGVRKRALYASSISHMVRHYGSVFPQLSLYADAQKARATVNARFAQLFDTAFTGYTRLEATSPQSARKVGELMQMTELDIDPRKPWDQQPWLHARPELKPVADAAFQKYNDLKRAGHHVVYDTLLAANEAMNYATMSITLFNVINSDPVLQQSIPGSDINPIDAYITSEDVYGSPESALNYWRATTLQQMKAASDYRNKVNDQISTKLEERMTSANQRELKDLEQRVSALDTKLVSMSRSIAGMKQSPYFHMGRVGDYFVSFSIRQKDGKLDPVAQDAVAKALADNGFGGAQLTPENPRANVFMRVQTRTQMASLSKLAHELKAKGLLDPDKDIKADEREAMTATGGMDADPKWLENYINQLRALYDKEVLKGATPSEKEAMAEQLNKMISIARELWLDALPDTAMAKVLTQRNAVPGYSSDMFTSFAQRMRVGANALAGLSTAPKVNNAFVAMRVALNDQQTKNDPSKMFQMRDVFTEIVTREADRPHLNKVDAFDRWRAWNHSFFLGLSPSYVLLNMTQVGVLLWPELSKGHGFIKSAKAIAKVTPTAFKIVKEVIKEAKKGGMVAASDGVISGRVLKAAGLSETDAKFVMRLVNTGNVDIGTFTRELTRSAEGRQNSTEDNIQRMAGFMGYYSEILTRLIAGLSARELNGKKSDDAEVQYADKTITESMLNYSTWNTSRMTGRTGIAGAFSPVMFAFMTYQFQLTEKLYDETYNAFKGDTPQTRKAARRFLGAHLAVMTTLAGSLGLPMATVLASVAEKFVDMVDDDEEPYDIKASWRNFLADTFGKDVGEVLARGLPRAAGIDIAQRVGEQDLIPFSRFLTDKRKFEDAFEDLAVDSLGSPVSMATNIVLGMRDMATGDVLQGLQKMMPMAIRGPVAAFRMGTDGYTDGKGNKLPMTPGATDILAQALGFKPAEKGEYDEARMVIAGRRTQLTRTSAEIRRKLAEAVESGDLDAQREMMTRARTFDKSNPAYAVLPGLAGTVQRRAQERAAAVATQTPMGTAPKDIIGRNMVQFGNIDYTRPQ